MERGSWKKIKHEFAEELNNKEIEENLDILLYIKIKQQVAE